MKCTNCGKKIESKMKYCPTCNYPVKKYNAIFFILVAIASVAVACLLKTDWYYVTEIGELFNPNNLNSYANDDNNGSGTIFYILLLFIAFVLWLIATLMGIAYIIALIVGVKGKKLYRFAQNAARFNMAAVILYLINGGIMDATTYSKIGTIFVYPSIPLIAILITDILNLKLFIPKAFNINGNTTVNTVGKICLNCGENYIIGNCCPKCGSNEFRN